MLVVVQCSGVKVNVLCSKLMTSAGRWFMPSKFPHPVKVCEQSLLKSGVLACCNVALRNVKWW